MYLGDISISSLQKKCGDWNEPEVYEFLVGEKVPV